MRGRIREVTGEPDFRWLLAGQFVAQAADGFAQATFANLLVLEPLSAETPERILYLFALTLLPYSLISPFMGVFVDRWARRSLMTGANIARGVLLITLPLWGSLLPGDGALYASALLLLSIGRLFLTTKGALLPVILHEHHLIGGNSVSSGGGMIAALAGGAAGLFASNVIADPIMFVASGLLYLVASYLTTQLSHPYSHPHTRSRNVGAAVVGISRDLFEGIREIWVRVQARIALIGIFLARTIGMFVFIGAIQVIKDVYPGRYQDFGRLSTSALALGAAGIGAFIGAATAPIAARRFDKGGLILLGFAISGVGIVALGGVHNLPSLLTLTLIGGYGGFVTKVAVDAQVQEALPDEFRGRAFALYDIIFNVSSVVAGVLMVLTESFSLRITLVFTGLVSLVLVVVLGLTMKRAEIPLITTPVSSQQA
jgi:MFS family permease